jgi:hypothetical protein
MTDLKAHRRTDYDPGSMPEVEEESSGELKFGAGSSFRVGSTERHVVGSDKGPVSRLGGTSGQVGQLARPSLHGRTVPHWQAVGALAGTLVAATGLATAAAIVIGAGKGAAMGALVGSMFPGAGTVVGAVVGSIVGGVVGGLVAAGAGALIGRVAAGGSDRDRAEKLIAGLVNAGDLTRDEAKLLKGMSNSDLSALVSIPKRDIATKADRDTIRRALLITAAKVGPTKAQERKADWLSRKSPGDARKAIAAWRDPLEEPQDLV